MKPLKTLVLKSTNEYEIKKKFIKGALRELHAITLINLIMSHNAQITRRT